jgi:hypothetical protein
VCKLRRSLYGLKQAPRQWYKKFDNFMCSTRFISTEDFNKSKNQLSKQFAIKDLGTTKQILRIRIIRDRANSTLKISQKEYVEKILRSENPADVLTKGVTIEKLKLCATSVGFRA